MLSRRHLRIKVMQALYAFFQSEINDLERGEKELFISLRKIYELYIYLLMLILEISDMDRNNAEEALARQQPGRFGLEKKRIFENSFGPILQNNYEFKKAIADYKLSWQKEQEVVRNIYLQIKKTDAYLTYTSSSENSIQEDGKFFSQAFQDIASKSEFLENQLEEQSIHWGENFQFACKMVLRTIQDISDKSEGFQLLKLFKDPEDDSEFAKILFRKMVNNDKEYTAMIVEKTLNWEVDRIALMDVILIKMCICEITNFSQIPIKVSINEYIEISKEYSSPKSKQFINGIADKIVKEMKEQGIIKKTGRGLLE